MKIILTSDLLKDCIAAVEEWPPVTVPVDSESINAEIFCLLDLLAQDSWILRRITDVNVLFIAEPRLVVGQHSCRRRIAGGANSLVEGTMNRGSGTSAANQENSGGYR